MNLVCLLFKVLTKCTLAYLRYYYTRIHKYYCYTLMYIQYLLLWDSMFITAGRGCPWHDWLVWYSVRGREAAQLHWQHHQVYYTEWGHWASASQSYVAVWLGFFFFFLLHSILSSLEQLEEFKIWHEYDMSEDNFCELEGMDIHIHVRGIVGLVPPFMLSLSLSLSLTQMRTLLG